MKQKDNISGIDAFYMRSQDTTLEICYNNNGSWRTHAEGCGEFSFDMLKEEKWSIRTRDTNKDEFLKYIKTRSFNTWGVDSVTKEDVWLAVHKFWPKENNE